MKFLHYSYLTCKVNDLFSLLASTSSGIVMFPSTATTIVIDQKIHILDKTTHSLSKYVIY